MTNPTLAGPEFTSKTPRMVGRKDEIERVRTCLYDRGARHFIYYWAGGGLGKTRLLQELQCLVQEAGPGFHSSGILDLYHTDLHGTSDIERAIMDGLDPEGRHFANYRRQRRQYELQRERGASPAAMEQKRASLSAAFVEDCRALALEARKIVLCFDTIELLQYESTIVEEMAGLETMDARVKAWFLDKLSQLANVLVIFAGRPRRPVADQRPDPQARLVSDMEASFGSDLTVIELEPFSLEETEEFIAAIKPDMEGEFVPEPLLPVVHRLTGGRPILLHLIVDLLYTLAPEPQSILDLFEGYSELLDVPEYDERLLEARKRIEKELVKVVFNEAGELGAYLIRIALMPKGVDAEILRQTLVPSVEEAQELLDRLEPLSFVKRFTPPPGGQRLHGERTFLHDEMYSLLTLPGVIPHLTINERMVARALTKGYYDPKIGELDTAIRASSDDPERRVGLRERMFKLQVERLYYILAQDPRQGYDEYKTLTEESNRMRAVGFSMRLLDEFLRFYSTPRRRNVCDAIGLTYQSIVRESAQLWVERLHWWGQYKLVGEFAEQLLDKPDVISVLDDTHLDILGNVCALWARAIAILGGYSEKAVYRAQGLLDRLPPLSECTANHALARARLGVTIGYHYQLAGMLSQATRELTDSLAAFRKTKGHYDEYTMAINNLAYAHAQQGRFPQARTLAHEALRVNEELGYDYATGLTLSTLSGIAMYRGNYHQAIEYGHEALDIFLEVEDSHGIFLVYKTLGWALRWYGTHEYKKGRRLEEAQSRLESAKGYLEKALDIANSAGFGQDRYLEIDSELGRLYRSIGNCAQKTSGFEKALPSYQESERLLNKVLKARLPKVERANTLHDLASVQYSMGNVEKARETLERVEEVIGRENLIIPSQQLPAETQADELFHPLGKVEWLRGRMALADSRPEDGAQHFVLAYAYIKRFSPDAVQVQFLLDDLYGYLHEVPEQERSQFMARVKQVAYEQALGVDVSPFVQTLQDLI